MIREVQDGQIIPVITRSRYNKLIEGDTVLMEKLLEYVRRPLALLTIKKAVERLPVEVLPNGIVQVQQSTTVRDKLRAEKEARQSVANSLEQDAAAYLDVLQDIIRELDAQSETVDYYIPGVTVQSRGITFNVRTWRSLHIIVRRWRSLPVWMKSAVSSTDSFLYWRY